MKLLIQPNCGYPLYAQIATGICLEIGWRRLKMGDALPPTRVLAAENGLDHKTVARAYAELRSQGVAFPSRPTGPYVIMSQAQHVAEAERDHALKIMEALLRAMRAFRRMPPELEAHRYIQESLRKFDLWGARLKELQQSIDSERAKPAHDLPGIISPTGIDEALAAMQSRTGCQPVSERPADSPAPLPIPQAAPGTPISGSARPAQDQTPEDTLWNNSQENPPALPAPSTHQQTTEDTPWNNSINDRADPPDYSRDQQTIEDTDWNSCKNSTINNAWDFAQTKTTPDTAWNNSGLSTSISCKSDLGADEPWCHQTSTIPDSP